MSAEEVVSMEWDDNGEVERAEVVLETLETLFNRLDRHIDLVTRQDDSVPHVVEHVMQGALAVVDMLYAGREDTCVDAIGYYQNSWEIDEEPEPAPLDVWARGAVVAKSSAPQPVTTKLSPAFGSRTPSLTGAIKKQVEEDAQSRQTDRSSTARTSKAAKPVNAASMSRQMTTRARLSPEEQEREDRLREEISIRRRQKQITQQLLATEEKARKDLAALQANLKGKDYAYDHRGEVVVMTKIDPTRMPSLLTKPAATVRDPEEEEAVVEKQSGRGKDGKGSTGNVSVRGKSSVPTETMFIERPNEAQPAPTETVKPVMGVTLTMGRTTKKGVERKTVNLAEMSREEYTYYIEESGHYQQLPKSEEFEREQQQKLEKQRAEFSSMQSTRQESVSTKRQQSLYRRASNGSRPSTESSEGGPLGLGVPSKGLPAWMLDAEPVPKPTKREPKKADVNKMLTSASDWGNSSTTIRRRDAGGDRENSLSPGKPRNRPSVELRERTVGKITRRPRDRQFGYITEQDLQEYEP